jgi:hypothetical protein
MAAMLAAMLDCPLASAPRPLTRWRRPSPLAGSHVYTFLRSARREERLARRARTEPGDR